MHRCPQKRGGLEAKSGLIVWVCYVSPGLALCLRFRLHDWTNCPFGGQSKLKKFFSPFKKFFF